MLYLADRGSSAFDSGRESVDVVCAGDSITGWNNFGDVGDWPFRTYPEYLQRLCEPLGWSIANAGIAGEVSQNGVGQVGEYLTLFPNARFFVLGYGSNDLDTWPGVERTSPRIIENLDRMVGAVREAGWKVVLLDVLNADESRLDREEAVTPRLTHRFCIGSTDSVVFSVLREVASRGRDAARRRVGAGGGRSHGPRRAGVCRRFEGMPR